MNGYEVALALAAGESPPSGRREGPYRAAASFPLRIFEPSRVVRAPDASDVARAESLYEKTLVWTECSYGDRLDDFESAEDGKSARYAIVNAGARDRETLAERIEAVKKALDYRFEPLASSNA